MLLPALLVLTLASPPPSERVEFVFGGDIIPHGWVRQAAADHALTDAGDAGPARSLNHEGWDPVLEPIAGVLRAADVAVVNLETPVTGNPRAPTAELIFDAPPALPQALAAAGVDVVTMANNHVFDQRRAGAVATWDSLKAAGLLHVGTGSTEAGAWEPLFVEKNGLKVGLLSLTRWLNGARNPFYPDTAPHVAYVPYTLNAEKNELDAAAAVELVRAAARRCDALIVLIHWGTEYWHTPSQEDRDLARGVLEAGALAIIGHHPHVLQPIERYRTTSGRDTLVAYSLGNLVANQDWDYIHRGARSDATGRKRDSMLLKLALHRPQPGAPVAVEGVAVLPVWIDNIRPQVSRTQKTPRRIQPVLLDEELKLLLARQQTLPVQSPKEPPEVRQERAALEQRLDLVRRRRELIFRIALPPGSRVPPVLPEPAAASAP